MNFKSLGFTGTRQGMTAQQMVAVDEWFKANGEKFTGFLHGCAIGADAWMAQYVDKAHQFICSFGYPSNTKGQRSTRAVEASDSVYAPAPPLERNRDIVNFCDTLLACPAKMEEEQKSGTWYTIRYARKHKKPIVIVWPDGTITNE